MRFDRQYIIVETPVADPDGRIPVVVDHLTIKKNYELGLFKTSLDKSWSRLTIEHTLAQPPASITIPLVPSPLALIGGKTFQVNIFGTLATGIDMGQLSAGFFSKHLNRDVRLLYVGGNGRREVPGAAYSPDLRTTLSVAAAEHFQPQRIRFADAAPLLLTSTSSEKDALMRLPPENRNQDLIIRFRPNIHVDVGNFCPPYDEDNWKSLRIRSPVSPAQEISVKCLFKTVRCLSLNLDPMTGRMAPREQQLYGLLAKDRRVNQMFPRKPVSRKSLRSIITDPSR